MLLLTGTSHQLRIVTGSAGADVRVRTEWLENNAGTITPDSQNTPSITTATTTVIVPSPTSGKQRNVGKVNVTNNHATQSTRVTVEHFDGTTAIPLMGVTLLPGENLVFMETGEWRHFEAQGAAYIYTPSAPGNLGLAGALAETLPRELCAEEERAVPSASGTIWMQAIYLYAGQVLNNIILCSSGTAAGTPTNWAAGIYTADDFPEDQRLLARTADQLTASFAANTVKTLPLTAPFRVPKTDLYYLVFLMLATTIVTLKSGQVAQSTALRFRLTPVAGTSGSGYTDLTPTITLAQPNVSYSLYAAVS